MRAANASLLGVLLLQATALEWQQVIALIWERQELPAIEWRCAVTAAAAPLPHSVRAAISHVGQPEVTLNQSS
jgi:hypothetical protein